MVQELSSCSEGQEVIRQLSSHYRSGNSSLGREFFSPCLNHCSEYRRAVGYFSSKALITWLEVLPRFAMESVKIYLLISPELSDEDREALAKALHEEERQQLRKISADRIVQAALEYSLPKNIQARAQLFAWMVANDHLVLQFAFPEHIEQPGIFHEKIGIFQFPWGDQVAFTGSANESEHGYERNYESIDVYRSWIDGDQERVRVKQEQFEEAWSARAAGLKVLPLSSESAALIRSKAPNEKPVIASKNSFTLPTTKEKPTSYGPKSEEPLNHTKAEYQWRHQDEAAAEFLAVKHGVLEMATGTGKTRTAIKALTALDTQGQIDGIILCKLNELVVVVDADAQQSSSKWLARLEQPIPCQVVHSPDELLDEMPKLAESYTWVIVDGPAALSETTRATVLSADLAIIPCQPTGVDLESASDTVRLVQQAQRIRRGEPKAVIFVNRAIKGTRLKDEAIEVLRLFPGVMVLDKVIHQRQIIADCFGQNSTVFDLSGSPAGIARREMEALFKQALEGING